MDDPPLEEGIQEKVSLLEEKEEEDERVQLLLPRPGMEERRHETKKVILYYSSLFGFESWNFGLGQARFGRCRVSNCYVTNDR